MSGLYTKVERMRKAAIACLTMPARIGRHVALNYRLNFRTNAPRLRRVQRFVASAMLYIARIHDAFRNLM